MPASMEVMASDGDQISVVEVRRRRGSLGGLHLGDVDVEVADRIGLELALRFLVASHLG